MSFEVKSFKGKEAEVYQEELADMRIRIFRDYPYLYEGSMSYEKEYLGRYFEADNAVIFILFYKSNVIGASTCIPLQQEGPEIQRPFLEQNIDVSKYFYLGESVIEKTYRGKGFGKLFFRYREEEALQHPHISFTCFCAVSRPDDHPLKPARYKPLYPFWEKLNYQPRPGLQALMSWKDIGEQEETAKKMDFWVKKIRNNS